MTERAPQKDERIVPPALVPGPPVHTVSYFDVFTALVTLQGRMVLIRHRLDRMPEDRRPAIAALLVEIETQIALLSRQLEAAERAGLGPPF